MTHVHHLVQLTILIVTAVKTQVNEVSEKDQRSVFCPVVSKMLVYWNTSMGTK